MFANKPTWLKSGLIFGGIILVLTILILSTKQGEYNNDDPFRETRRALDAVLENSFSQSGGGQIRPIDPNADWLRDSNDDPYIGPKDAKIVIMEFSDFQCPFCKASFPAIREITANNPEIKYIYRDFPIDELHPESRIAAMAGGCAHDQDLFWPYHDRLFQNQHNLTRDGLFTYARQSGLNMRDFTECFDEGKFANDVEQDRLIGIDLGVRGTPTWFINGEKVEGVIPTEGWEQLLELL